MIANVLRGVELLDRKIPGWRSQIDVERLDIASLPTCVVGQLGGFVKFCAAVGWHWPQVPMETFERHGFSIVTDETDLRYAELSGIWKGVLSR